MDYVLKLRRRSAFRRSSKRWFIAIGVLGIASTASLLVNGGLAAATIPAMARHPYSSTVVLKEPASLAVGPNGDLYIADIGQILRRLPDGHFEVVAGTGIAGDSGDGGRATQAELDNPGSLAIAPNGTLYVVQSGRMKVAGGILNSVVREVAPNGVITTIIGQDPNCRVVRPNSISVPAKSAEFFGAWLTIASSGLLDIATTVCPNILRLGSFLQLTSTGELVQTPADSIPKTSDCGNEVAGPGFIVFGCMSGAGQGPRLMVVRSNGSIENYPDNVSQPNDIAASNGTVVAIHNRAVVRVGVSGLHTIATPRQVADLIPGAIGVMGDNGVALDRHGNVYFNQDFLVAHRGCTDVIFKIDPSGRIRTLWRSGFTRFCY